MSLPNNKNRLERFIHEYFHEIARDDDLKDTWRDMVAIIIGKWEKYKEENMWHDKRL